MLQWVGAFNLSLISVLGSLSIGSANEGIIWMKVWIILGKVHHCNLLIYGEKTRPLTLDLFGACEDIWSENTGNHMPAFI